MAPDQPINNPLTPRPDARPNSWLEKRKFLRFNLPAAVVLRVPRKMMGALGMKRDVAARLIDLSEGGSGLFIPEELVKGTVLGVHIEVKQMGDTLDVVGEVIRCTPPLPASPVQEWIICVEFDEVTKEDQVKIAGWRAFFGSTMIRKKNEEKRRDFGLG